MIGENLFMALNDIDEEFLDECDEQKKKISVVKILSIAAAFIAVLSVGILFVENHTDSQNAIIENTSITDITNATAPTENESATDKDTSIQIEIGDIKEEAYTKLPWEKLHITLKFEKINHNNTIYISTGHYTLNKSSYIETQSYSIATLTAYDDNMNEHKENVKIYRIKNLSENIAVAVKFASDNHFYVYANSIYSPDTLGELLSESDFENNITLQNAQMWENRNTKNEEHIATVKTADKKLIMNVLFVDKNLKPVSAVKPDKRQVEIYMRSEKANLSGNITVYDNGYFSVNFFQMFTDPYSSFNGSNVSFYVGKENTDKIFEYVDKEKSMGSTIEEMSSAYVPQ